VQRTRPQIRMNNKNYKSSGSQTVTVKEDGVPPVYIGEVKPEFVYVDYNQPHWKRKKLLMTKYPDALEKYGHHYPLSALYIVLIVLLQTAVTYLVHESSYLTIFIVGYTVGAVADHAMWVLIHDCTHNAVLGSNTGNLFMHVVANIPLFWPSALSFRYYHLMHHANLNTTYGDPDVPSEIENKIFGHSALGKITWLLLFPYIQAARMIRYQKKAAGIDFWTSLSFVVQVVYNSAVYYYWGLPAVVYLLISTTFAVGLHPLGARWIAEHYASQPKQETYSYYGVLNKVSFNIGYHNEHHDLPMVPWVHLPKLTKNYSEFYKDLITHPSYLGVLFNFFFDSRFTLETRVVRPYKGN
jgi:sphingolipid delta-4 desaturase